MEVTFSLNLTKLKSDIRNILDAKVARVKTDSLLREELMWALLDVAREDFPVDSGALQSGTGPLYSSADTWTDAKGRTHKRTLYPRYGRFYLTSNSKSMTMHIDPFEERPDRDVHYASHREEDIRNAIEDTKVSPEFLARAHELITERFRE